METYKPVQILLVEDNPDDIEITRRALAKSRIANSVTIARDGSEALALLLGGEDAPDALRPNLILLDLNLPRVSGIEVLQTLRGSSDPRLAATPVIVLTSSSREEDVVRSYQLGSNTFIQKPVEFDKFLHAVAVLGEYWIVIATLPNAA